MISIVAVEPKEVWKATRPIKEYVEGVQGLVDGYYTSLYSHEAPDVTACLDD